jgi:hypothetical protein
MSALLALSKPSGDGYLHAVLPEEPRSRHDTYDFGGGEDCDEEKDLRSGYGFFFTFLPSFAIGFGMKNHQASMPKPIVQPTMMTQLPSDAISI